jgi:hypothetical protein
VQMTRLWSFKNLSILTSTLVTAWGNSSQLAAQDINDYRPIIVTSSEGTIDNKSDRILVEIFSSVLKTGALKTLGREFYGVGGESFAGVGSKGPIGVMSSFLKQSDIDMVEKLALAYSNIKAPTSEIKTSTIDLYWTRRKFSSPSSSFQSNAMSILLKMFLSDLPSNKDSDSNPFSLKTVANLSSLQIVRLKELPVARTSFIQETKDFLQLVSRAKPASWFPIQLHASIKINRERVIGTRVSISMKPVGFEAPSREAGGFVIESMKYLPASENGSIFQASFDRLYSPRDIGVRPRPAPIVDLNFGFTKKDSMDSDICIGNDCLTRTDKVPTIYARLNAGWLWKFLAGTLSLHEFKILVNALAVNIDQMSVNGEKSEIPLIMRTQTWGWKVVDTKRNLRPLNPIEAIQKSFISDSVSQGISAQLQEAGDQAEQSLNETLRPIINLLQ